MLFLVKPIDFINQYDGILYHHTHQAHQADDGHEGEWLMKKKQGWSDATKYKWNTAEY